MHATRSEAATFHGKHSSSYEHEALATDDGAQGPDCLGPLIKPGVSTRSGLASGASRRALGDITNNRGAPSGKPGQHNTSKAMTRAMWATAAAGEGPLPGANSSFGLASVAPPPVLYEQPLPAPQKSDMDGKRREEAVDDMDLIQEVEEIDMHIEEASEMPQEAIQAESQEALGAIIEDLQGMTLKYSTARPVLGLGVDDIDAVDASNPLACVDYVESQYSHYREKECRPGYDPGYMKKQPYINVRMRAILVDWLVEVHYKFKCCPETLYLTVNLIDRFLDRKQVPRPKLQLVGVTAFLIACKYEEIYPPEVKELVYMTDAAYTRKQIIDMEAFMLATLKFQVTVCTTHCFLVRFLKAGHADNKLYFLASYIAERTLQEVDVLCFLPSMVAAAAVYLARKNCGMRSWSPTLNHYTKYSEEALLPCLRVLSPWLHSRSQTLQAIRKKYGAAKFMMVSSLELTGVV